MTPGSVIAVTAVGGMVGGLLYGCCCDLRRWWDDRHSRARVVAFIDREHVQPLWRFGIDATNLDPDSEDELAAQLREIRSLPTARGRH